VKRYKVEFIGGPVDGTKERFTSDELTRYLGCVFGRREYLYKFSLSKGGKGPEPITIKRKYVFQGHKAVAPEVDHG
jgi:hypothetical protein